MHLPKVAEKYFNSPFFIMAANAILKTRKIISFELDWQKEHIECHVLLIFWHNKINGIIAIMFFGMIVTFKSKMAANAILKIRKSDIS